MRNRTTLLPKTDDCYLALIKRFPLRRIRSSAERIAAASLARELALRGPSNLDPGEMDYLEALARFIADFESQSRRDSLPHASPLEILKHLMDQRSLRPGDLGKLIGPSAATMVLKGQRELSKSHIRKLAAFFNVNPGLFI